MDDVTLSYWSIPIIDWAQLIDKKASYERIVLLIWFIGQAWGQDGWAKFFLFLFFGIQVHKKAKTERGQYPAIFDRIRLVKKGFIVWSLLLSFMYEKDMYLFF